MASILTSLGRTVLAGFILLLIIIFAFGGFAGNSWTLFTFRWLHVTFPPIVALFSVHARMITLSAFRCVKERHQFSD